MRRVRSHGMLVRMRHIALTVLTSLALAATAAAHGGGSPGAAPGTVTLRDCWLTVAYVPRPAGVLKKAFARPPDLSQTFYGPDPMLGIWAVSCDRGRAAGTRTGRVTLSLVGVPVRLSVLGAPPLANFLSHALIRADTDSRVLAAALRRAGLPARLAKAMRYRHSPAGAVPFRGALTVPGRYSLLVRAGDADPTNPHDHVNRFDHRGRNGRLATLGLSADDAFDRFCLSSSGACTASVGAPRRSALARLLGGSPAIARVGFDHARLGRLDLSTRQPRRTP
jgi:hypothetical protein